MQNRGINEIMRAVSITKTINIHIQFLSENLLNPEAMGGLFKCETPDENRARVRYIAEKERDKAAKVERNAPIGKSGGNHPSVSEINEGKKRMWKRLLTSMKETLIRF